MEPEIDLKRVKNQTHRKTKQKTKKLSPVIANDHQNAIFFATLKAKSSFWALEKMANLNVIGVQGDKAFDSHRQDLTTFSILGQEELQLVIPSVGKGQIPSCRITEITLNPKSH